MNPLEGTFRLMGGMPKCSTDRRVVTGIKDILEDAFVSCQELMALSRAHRSKRVKSDEGQQEDDLIPTENLLEELFRCRDSKPLGDLLKHLAFDIQSDDPFKLFGLDRLAGPMPTATIVENRRALAIDLVEYLSEERFQIETDAWSERVNLAAERCKKELDDIKKRRKLIFGASGDKHIPRWLELPLQAIEDVAAAIGFPEENCLLATQLSNVLNLQLPPLAPMTTVEEARVVHRFLHGSSQEITDGIRRLSCPIVAWAPDKEDQIRRVADAVRKKPVNHSRSEERRVGKECRSRWSPYH